MVKTQGSLEDLLKDIEKPNRKELNSWFYNAKDEELTKAISLLNSKEITQKYPRHHLKEYIKFARALLSGQLREPPTELDLCSEPIKNYYNFAIGCYSLTQIIQSLIHLKYRVFIRKCSIMLISSSINHTDSRGISTLQVKNNRKITKPLASFCRILNSRALVCLKLAFDSISKESQPFFSKKFKTKVQLKRIKLNCANQMIRTGRINLEQRALWKWKVVVEDLGHFSGKPSLKDDFMLLKLLGHNGNLRYFHVVKKFFERWRGFLRDLVLSDAILSKEKNESKLKHKDFRYYFKRKLKKKLQGLSNLIYGRLSTCFDSLRSFAESRTAATSPTKRLNHTKPFIRNLVHIFNRILSDAFFIWKQPEYEYEYEQFEEVVTTTVSKEIKNFAVYVKPIVLYEIHEKYSKYKCTTLRNLAHLMSKKLRLYWNVWVNFKKSVEMSLSAEVTLDLAMFKLPAVRFGKLRIIMAHLLTLSEVRKNLPRAVLSTWMQKSNKRNLTIASLKVIIQNQQTNRETIKHAFTAFQLSCRYQTEFTDIA